MFHPPSGEAVEGADISAKTAARSPGLSILTADRTHSSLDLAAKGDSPTKALAPRAGAKEGRL